MAERAQTWSHVGSVFKFHSVLMCDLGKVLITLSLFPQP